MIGIIIGLICGSIELFLLGKLTMALLTGKTSDVIVYLISKLAVFALAMAIVVVFFRNQLVLAGATTAVVLVLGSIILRFYNSHCEKKSQVDIAKRGDTNGV